MSPAFSAWFGSRIGVRHALEKLRNEKAFERRLTWYEDTVLATVAVRDRCAAYAIATRYDTSKLGTLSGELTADFSLFAEGANKAVLYAPKHTVQRMDELIKELVKLAVALAQKLERGELHEEFAKEVDSLTLSLSRFVFELAQELRTELGLEKIELSDVQKNALDIH